MSIGKRRVEAEVPSPEWCVPVSQSVAENVPAAILRPWIILETFARSRPDCWPGNKALAARLGVKIRAAQLTLEQIEDHGIAERRTLGGNHRIIVLIRRTSEPMSSVEWKAIADRAARRTAGRVALAKSKAAERKRYKPPHKIVG